MEEYVKTKLNTSVLNRIGRSAGGGCISDGCAYETDDKKVFIKTNSDREADVMFKGEYEGLKAIRETNTVKVPEPLLLGKVQNKAFIVLEYFDLAPLKKLQIELGKSLAKLHLHNINALNHEESAGFVGNIPKMVITEFGFHTTTCCGYLPLNNTWSKDWLSFYANQRLGTQIKMIEEKGDREIGELWSQLQLKLPSFFENIQIQPSLLHGDLWAGNAGEADGEPVIFDCAAFYGHHEFDLSIAKMFGGFTKAFFEAYHSVIPKANGFDKRLDLYLLFHHLNHWNHFGSQYKLSTMSLMRSLLKY